MSIDNLSIDPTSTRQGIENIINMPYNALVQDYRTRKLYIYNCNLKMFGAPIRFGTSFKWFENIYIHNCQLEPAAGASLQYPLIHVDYDDSVL